MMKKRILTMMLSLFVAACLFPTVALAAEPTGNNVAEISGTKYETLKAAVENSKEMCIRDRINSICQIRNICYIDLKCYITCGSHLHTVS